MKKIKLIIMVLGLTFLFNTSLMAQTNTENTSINKKSENETDLKLEVTGMTCQLGYANGLDKLFSETKGIHKSKTSYEHSLSEINYNPKLISEEEIIAIIKEVGFSAKAIKDDN